MSLVEIVLHAAALIYLVCTLLLALFVGSFGVLLAIYARTRSRSEATPALTNDQLPSVTVQLPIYNELHVAARLIDAAARLDYPRDRLRVQVLDDSTDGTTAILRRQIQAWRAQGVEHIVLLRRPVREGYKAGALAWGLQQVSTEYVAVFDADFVPAPDFLRRTVPHFTADPRLALVQSRWEHLNPEANWLTRAQALTIDGHFAVEQTARCRGGLPFAMNGTGAVWRTAALRDAGGWSAATVAEDLDISYRALLRGWRMRYLPEVAVPGELPEQIQAYKRQQRRWATGMTENLLHHARPLLRSAHYDPGAKFMGLMHLASFAVQPLILLVLLLTPPLIAAGLLARLPNLGLLLGPLGLIPVLIMVTGQLALGRPAWRTLRALPVQGLIAAALVLNNTLGVLAGLHPRAVRREFKRTPKFSEARSGSPYTLPLDGTIVGEIALGAYALGGAALALERFPALLPYLLTYGLALWGMVLATLWQAWPRTAYCTARQRAAGAANEGAPADQAALR